MYTRCQHAIGRQFGNRPARPQHLQHTTGQQLSQPHPGLLRKYLILLILQAWLAALDDFRNWLVNEAA